MQQPTARTEMETEQGQEQRPPQDGQNDNTQIVAIPIHLSFPHSTTFEGAKQEQTLIKEQRRKKDEEREQNPTGCKYCAKHGGNGYAHAVPKKIPHDKCNFNPKYKGWRPKWVCNKLEIKYKEWFKFEHWRCGDRKEKEVEQ